MYDPLTNEEFLNKLFTYTEREIFARVLLLSYDETHCIEEIQGRVTSGSINVNGTSAVRRTCNLTLVTTDMDINAFHWGLHTKFSLSVGLKNFIDIENYPEIVWFPAGVYVITSLTTSQETGSFTMSIQGQDKMCLLNGSIGGTIGTIVNFGQLVYDDTELNQEIREDRLLKNIIFDLVHTYGLEPIQNIIINDVNNKGIELLEYRGETPLYLFKKYWDGLSPQSYYYENMSLDGSQVVYAIEEDSEGNEVEKEVTLENFEKYYTFDTLNENEINIPTKVYLLNKDMVQHGKERDKYIIARIQYGETAGYRPTELTYPGDLISTATDNVTTILDKIVQVLGDYEYYYDIYGHFIFQEKQTFVNTPWNGTGESNNETYFKQTGYESCYKFSFDNGTLITSFNNSPNIANMKNDYFVHGTREGTGGGSIPIHMRYAIAKKPTEYTSIAVNAEAAAKYGNNKSQDHTTYTTDDWDWREIIYQMAHDYYQYGSMDDFFARVRQANRIYPENKDLFPFGTTGYEMFYTDLMSYWRELYNPDAEVTYEAMTSPISGVPIKVIDDLKRPIRSVFVDEDGKLKWKYVEEKLTQEDFERKIYQLGLNYIKLPFDDYKNTKVKCGKNEKLNFNTIYYNESDEVLPYSLAESYLNSEIVDCYKEVNRFYQCNVVMPLLPYKLYLIPSARISPNLFTAASQIPELGFPTRLVDCADYKYQSYEVQSELDKNVQKYITDFKNSLNDLEWGSSTLQSTIYNQFTSVAKNIWNNCKQLYYCHPYTSEIVQCFGNLTSGEGNDDSFLGYKEQITINSDDLQTYIEITNPEMFALCLRNNNVFVKRYNMYFTNIQYAKSEYYDSNKKEPYYQFILNGSDEVEDYVEVIGNVTHSYKNIIKFHPTLDSDGQENMILILDDMATWLLSQESDRRTYIYQDVPDYYQYRKLNKNDTYDEDETYYRYTCEYISGYHQTFSEYTDIYEYDAVNKVYQAIMFKGRNGLYQFREEKETVYNYREPTALEVWGSKDEKDEPLIYCKAIKAFQINSEGKTLVNEYTEYEEITTEQEFLEQTKKKNVFVRLINTLITTYEPKQGKSYYTKTCQYYKPIDGVDKSLYYWNKNVVNSPELLNYWLDFLDGDDLAKYSINVVGDRPKAVNDNKATAIYYRETPAVIFLTDANEYDELESQGETSDGYNYIYLNSDYENMFSISSQGKDAHSVIDDMVYNYSYCVESVTINAIPIYTLEPNTQVSIYDETSKINGLYNITSLSIPLTHNGTMSIQATKVVDRIY